MHTKFNAHIKIFCEHFFFSKKKVFLLKKVKIKSCTQNFFKNAHKKLVMHTKFLKKNLCAFFLIYKRSHYNK